LPPINNCFGRLRKSKAATDFTPDAARSIDGDETDAAIAHSPLAMMVFAN
jgi:hypothetical protein